MGFTIGRAFLITGILLLLHCTYSAQQYRRFLRDVGEDYEGLPGDIILECIITFFICYCGIILSAPLKPITLVESMGEKTFDMMMDTRDFMIFEHRGKAFTQNSKKEQ